MIDLIVVVAFLVAVSCVIAACFIDVRNRLVYRVRLEAIDKGTLEQLPSYNAMMFQLTKWTYESFTRGLK